MTTRILLTFYRAAIESVLTFSIRLNRVVKTASRIIGRDLPSFESLYQQRLLGRANLISHDSSHLAHDLFDPLPCSRRFRSIKTRTNSFSTVFSHFFPTCPVKKEVRFLPSVFHTYSTFPCILVCIPYHNLLYIILFYILHFMILCLYYIISTIICRCYKEKLFIRTYCM